MRRLAASLFVLLLPACQPSLGPCEPALAEEVVYRVAPEGSRDDGRPAYAGQALVVQSCGAGSFCHADAAAAEERHGAPAGLDFDLRPPCPDDRCREEDLARLARDHARTRRLAEELLASVERRTMPPRGEAGRRTRALGGHFRRADGTTLPEVDSDEGTSLLRAWLACGAPVVERTAPAPPGGDEGEPCDLPTTVGACLTHAP